MTADPAVEAPSTCPGCAKEFDSMWDGEVWVDAMSYCVSCGNALLEMRDPESEL